MYPSVIDASVAHRAPYGGPLVSGGTTMLALVSRAALSATGVFGFAAQDSAAVGVHGRSTVGTGVRAQADVAGTALRVEGKATFSRSGVVTVAAGKSSATKSVVGLTSSSLVFAVIRTGDGQAFVRKVQPTAGSFTVYVNKVLSSTTTIAWIAFG